MSAYRGRSLSKREREEWRGFMGAMFAPSVPKLLTCENRACIAQFELVDGVIPDGWLLVTRSSGLCRGETGVLCPRCASMAETRG